METRIMKISTPSDTGKTNPISNPLLFADNRQNFFTWKQIWKNKPLAATTNVKRTQNLKGQS